MHCAETEGILSFIKQAENLKNTHRFAFTSTGKRESAAEHSWRLCLLVMVYASSFPKLNLEKCFKLAIVHDLGEAVCGDTPAIFEKDYTQKAALERKAVAQLTQSLPESMQSEMLAVWDEYEQGVTEEAKMVKALDKLETLIQHNQGVNPPDFNYNFNLTYGLDVTKNINQFKTLREIIDKETLAHLAK